MLVENSLFGELDKVATSIERIKKFSVFALDMHPEGFFVRISGGRDSSIIQDLVLKSGVPAEFYHQHTSVDHPETIRFIRQEKARLEKMGYTFDIQIPRYRNGKQRTMWKDIVSYGLPSRNFRWCCRRLKEFGGIGRYCITGIRWAKTPRNAKKRGIHEYIQKDIHSNSDEKWEQLLKTTRLNRQKMVLNPIIDWTDSETAEYVKANNLLLNPLYAQGHCRVGCIGCPLPNDNDVENYPRYYALYKKAATKFLEHKKEIGSKLPTWMSTPELYMETWIKGKVEVLPGLDFEKAHEPPGQAFFSQKGMGALL